MTTTALAEFQSVLAAHGVGLDAAEAREFAITLIDLIASGLLVPRSPAACIPSRPAPREALAEGCGRLAADRDCPAYNMGSLLTQTGVMQGDHCS